MSSRTASIAQRWRRFKWSVVRDLYGHPGGRAPKHRPPVSHPGEGSTLQWELVAGGYVVALVLPVIVGAMFIPFRDDLTTATVALILVVPVVIAALIGGVGPSALGAVSSVLTFDVFFTEPHYRLVIDAVEDVEIALVLLLIGLLVDQLAARQAQLRKEAEVRADELDALTAVVARSAAHPDPQDLVIEVGQRLQAVLDLHGWEWAPGYHGTGGPVLQPDGSMTPGPTHHVDAAELPGPGLELPVVGGGVELGRFVLQRTKRRRVSVEQRKTAVAIAEVMGMACAHLPLPPAIRGSRGRTPRSVQ